MKNVVVLKVVHISSRYPKGAFEAHYFKDGKNTSKQCALHVNDADIAFQTVDIWAEDAVKKTGFKYVKTSQKQLQKAIDIGSNRPADLKRGGQDKKPTDGISTGSNRSLLSNQKYLKQELDRVFPILGHERLTELLKVGRDYLNGLERERKKIAQNTGKAKTNMAEAMYKTYKETGVDTSLYCNDEEILNIFNSLKDNVASIDLQGPLI